MATVDERLKDIAEQIERCWVAAEIFLLKRDFHGLHDMGVEIAGFELAKAELLKLT